MKISKKWVVVSLSLFSLFILWIGMIHNVDTNLTKQDLAVLNRLFPQEPNNSSELSFEKQVDQIERIIQKTSEIAKSFVGIAYNSSREPADFIKAQVGLCYDRSRFIEKSLTFLGYEVRHLAIYYIVDESALKSILSPGIPSHSVSEVKTKMGWMYIDPNSGWISLSNENKPISVASIHDKGLETFEWRNADTPDIMKTDFIFIYGLYSRHGKFYAPYTFIPDVNYRQLLMNFS